MRLLARLFGGPPPAAEERSAERKRDFEERVRKLI